MHVQATSEAEASFRNRTKRAQLARGEEIAPARGGQGQQPLLKGMAALALVPPASAPNLPPRKSRAPFLFRHPRRKTLEQLLIAAACVLPLAPAVRAKARGRYKLPVIGQRGRVDPESRLALDDSLSKAQIDAILAANPRPTTRAECEGGVRPCPFVSCRHHLMLDVHPTSGAIKLNHPNLESMKETCALDYADKVAASEHGVARLADVGEHLGISNERVRQIQREAEHAFTGLQGEENSMRWAAFFERDQ